MFDRDSRYAKLPVKTLIDDQGREIAFVTRRIIPDAPRIIAKTPVQDGDRLDLVANRAYGDARQSWRVMDANPDPDPLTLADTPGRRLNLSQPGEEG
ncbi:MAG: LysM domain-containing protein [Cypionkella sp.]